MVDRAINVADTKKVPRQRIVLIITAILSVAILSVFIDNKLSTFLGPVIAALLCYLFFSGYSETVIAIVLIANDALGTIAFGSASFPYLLLVLVVIKFALNRQYSLREYGFVAVSFLLAAQLFLLESTTTRQLIYSITFIMALVLVGKSKEGMERFFRGVALIVVLIALHTCITGGVEFYTQDRFSDEFLRKGVLGVGLGDSNFSCFLLNIGVICLWCDRKTHWLLKAVATVPILYAVTVTLSTSGLISLIMISILFILSKKNKFKAFVILLLVVLVIIATYSIYVELPAELRLEPLDAYIERVTEKINQLAVGDMAGATTNRSELADAYWDYFTHQTLFGILFGGNGIAVVDGMAPHNTYIGYLLQIGIIGALMFFGYSTIRLVQCWNNREEDLNRKRTLLLKILCLFIATNLSLYDGSLWAMWMYFLVMM